MAGMQWDERPHPYRHRRAKVMTLINHLNREGAFTMKLTTVGTDLAKNVLQVHGIDEHGKVLVKMQLRRDQMATFFVNLPPCLLAWRLAAARITGRASFRQWGTPYA